MFKRILIANRGEIACRIMRTCRRMGIETVAVYSSADAGARHVVEADFAVPIGGPSAADSYLRADRIIEAAQSSAAQAIHPGYGFLSEKLELIDACAQHGIVFIGPQRQAIESMGSKIESKRMARQAGVDCVPGYDGDDQSTQLLTEQAAQIGYPLLIKASAGGGGKGMRLVNEASAFESLLTQARAEANAAFGDDRVLLEKAIKNPRHLEVQIVGDQHGNLVHLFERECSIQRRFQKIIEEAPANHLPVATAERLYEAALKIGRTISYENAGTVEFVLDGDTNDTPYFLEVNTRLQVEHPVTELITGIDLVAWQLTVAAGDPLPLSQDQITREGWAIEARVNAEDPAHDYRASIGTVLSYAEPVPKAGVRIDSGLHEGSEVTPYFDSMLAKVIGYGADRDQAVALTCQALRSLRIGGLQTNVSLLEQMLSHPAFTEPLTTGFIEDYFPDGPKPEADNVLRHRLAVATAWSAGQAPALPLWNALQGFRVNSQATGGARISLRLRDNANDEPAEAVTIMSSDGGCRLTGCAELSAVVAEQSEPNSTGGLTVTVSDESGAQSNVWVWQRPEQRWHSWLDGRCFTWEVGHELAHTAPGAGESARGEKLMATLPGRIDQLMVSSGQAVHEGMPVLTMEAMKLFHTLTAPFEGTVRKVHVQPGDVVSHQQLLVEFEPSAVPDTNAAST